MEVEWYACAAGGIVMVASQDLESAIRIFRREFATRQHRLIVKPIFSTSDEDRFFQMRIHVCIFLPLSRGRQIRVPQDFAGQNFELRLQYGG